MRSCLWACSSFLNVMSVSTPETAVSAFILPARERRVLAQGASCWKALEGRCRGPTLGPENPERLCAASVGLVRSRGRVAEWGAEGLVQLPAARVKGREGERVRTTILACCYSELVLLACACHARVGGWVVEVSGRRGAHHFWRRGRRVETRGPASVRRLERGWGA